MRTKVTLFLLFLNVALFAFIFGFEREWRTDRAFLEIRRRVLGPAAANIHTLQISGPGLATPIALARNGENWFLTAPVQWPANPHAVSRIINELQFLEHETSFAVADLAANEQNLADYGLAEPALTVTFTAAPASDPAAPPPAPIALALGSETTVGNRLYVLSPDGRRIHVVNRSLAESLRLSLDQLRSDTAFTIPVFEVRSLNLQTATPANLRIRLRRDGNRWSFEAPIIARASKTATELTLNRLNQLRTRRFLGATRDRPELVAESGTADPTFRVTLEGNNRRETLLLGREIGPVPAPIVPGQTADPAAPPDLEYYARMEDRDALFTVALPASLLDSLRGAQETLRDRRVLDLEGRTITSLALSAPNYPELTLQRFEPNATTPSAAWQLVRADAAGTPRTEPADPAIVDRLLQNLTLLEARQFLRDAPSDLELENWGLVRPIRRLELTFAPAPGLAAGPVNATLLLGVASEREGRVYAKLAQQPFVYLVDPRILDLLPVVPRSYRDRLLRELPAGTRLTGLTLTDLEDQSTLYAHTLAPGETWETVLAAEPPARRAALTTLRAQLRTLRAERITADGFTPTIAVNGEERPWAYRVEATLALSGGPGGQSTTSSLFFAARDGGSLQLVGAPEFDLVFEAPQPLLDAMWALTYGPRDPGPATTEPGPAGGSAGGPPASSPSPASPVEPTAALATP